MNITGSAKIVTLMGPVLAVLVLASAAVSSPARAIRCSAFLHGRDGSWRSLEAGSVFGPNGRVQIGANDILRPTDRTAKGDVARALNDLCESQ